MTLDGLAHAIVACHRRPVFSRCMLAPNVTVHSAEGVAFGAHGSPGRIADHISLGRASSFTASRDFVTWSAGEILSSADENTATILRSGAMTKVVRSVNA